MIYSLHVETGICSTEPCQNDATCESTIDADFELDSTGNHCTHSATTALQFATKEECFDAVMENLDILNCTGFTFQYNHSDLYHSFFLVFYVFNFLCLMYGMHFVAWALAMNFTSFFIFNCAVSLPEIVINPPSRTSNPLLFERLTLQFFMVLP